MKTILDKDSQDKQEELKKIMSRSKQERILPMYDTSDSLREMNIKNNLYICNNDKIAGASAFNNSAWCILYQDGMMRRYQSDVIAPIIQNRIINKNYRQLTQIIIDMLKECDVYFYTDDVWYIEKIKDLSINIIEQKYIDNNADSKYFNFDIFKDSQSYISRIDFVLHNSGNYFTPEEMKKIKYNRDLRFIILNDGLYILDESVGVVYACIAKDISLLTREEKDCLLNHKFVLNGRCFQGKIDGVSKYIGNIFLPQEILFIINKLKSIKIDYFKDIIE